MLSVTEEKELTSHVGRIISKPKACSNMETERAPSELMDLTKENFRKNAESTKWFTLAAYVKIWE